MPVLKNIVHFAFLLLLSFTFKGCKEPLIDVKKILEIDTCEDDVDAIPNSQKIVLSGAFNEAIALENGPWRNWEEVKQGVVYGTKSSDKGLEADLIAKDPRALLRAGKIRCTEGIKAPATVVWRLEFSRSRFEGDPSDEADGRRLFVCSVTLNRLNNPVECDPAVDPPAGQAVGGRRFIVGSSQERPAERRLQVRLVR